MKPFTILAMTAGLAFAGCASAPPPPAPRQVADTDAGPVSLARGQILDIALPLNAGTGYGWRLDREAPADVLSGGSSRTTDAGGLPGGPIKTIYSYQAVGRGTADLSFTLKRPWEADKPDDRRVAFKIQVR